MSLIRSPRLVALLPVLLSGGLLSACHTHNVVFPSRPTPGEPRVIEVYYDRVGDLYPDGDIPIDIGRPYIELANQFRKRRREQVWTDLKRQTGVGGSAAMTFEKQWAAVQEVLIQRNAERIVRAIQRPGGSHRTLAILVHGFNNNRAEAEDWYKAAQPHFGNPDDVAFLHVYWDGLETTGIAPLPVKSWTGAQANFPHIGLEFRRLLRAIHERAPSVPVRILTHSSGGPLIASTLGNASLPFKGADSEEFKYYHANIRGEDPKYAPAQFRDMRVAMIVPAASGDTYVNFTDMAINLTAPQRLIIGINREDYAITKTVAPCGWFGYTCLSQYTELACAQFYRKLKDDAPHIKPYLFEMHDSSNKRWFFFWDDHAMTEYIKRPDFPRIMRLLLEDKPTEQDEAAQMCGSAPS